MLIVRLLAGCVWEGSFASKPAPTLALRRSYTVCPAQNLCGSGLAREWHRRRGLSVRLTPLEHQPNNRLRRRFIIGLIQLALAGHRRYLPIKVGVGLRRRPDADHQVIGVNGGNQAAIHPALDAVDVVLGLGVQLLDLLAA